MQIKLIDRPNRFVSEFYWREQYFLCAATIRRNGSQNKRPTRPNRDHQGWEVSFGEADWSRVGGNFPFIVSLLENSLQSYSPLLVSGCCLFSRKALNFPRALRVLVCGNCRNRRRSSTIFFVRWLLNFRGNSEVFYTIDVKRLKTFENKEIIILFEIV